MQYSNTKIWIHAIIIAKDRLPLIHPDFEQTIYKFFIDELKNLSCPVEIINGTADHIHMILLLDSAKSIDYIIKQIKGSSKQAINQLFFPSGSFSWQEEYLAFSISESQLIKVLEYIKNQKDYHKKNSFLKEYDEFIKVHGLK